MKELLDPKQADLLGYSFLRGNKTQKREVIDELGDNPANFVLFLHYLENNVENVSFDNNGTSEIGWEVFQLASEKFNVIYCPFCKENTNFEDRKDLCLIFCTKCENALEEFPEEVQVQGTS